MAGRNGSGNGLAKTILMGLAILLVVGIAGSLFMGARARSSAQDTIVGSARDIAGNSLTLVFTPADLTAPVSDSRALTLSDKIQPVVIDSSAFDSVTLWSEDGQILYSTDEGRIGNTLDGEREQIREVLKGKAGTSITEGELAVMLPFQLKSGVGQPAVVEMTTSAEPITSASGPWRTNAIFLGLILIVVAVVLYRMARQPAAAYGLQANPQRAMAPSPLPAQAPQAMPAPRPITVPTPGIREEADARKKAEDRARAAEERLSVLQDQYRNTLEDLQATQRRLQEQATNARQDPAMQERVERAELRAREYEQRAIDVEAKLRTLSNEHEQLARLLPDPDVLAKANDQLAQLTGQRDSLRKERDALVAERDELTAQRADLAKRLDAGSTPTEDPEIAKRLQQSQTELIGMRAELDGAQTQLTMARRELETLRTQAEHTRELQQDLDAAHVEALHARETAETAEAELNGTRNELEDARNELRVLRNEEQRAAMLEDELRAAKAEIESVSASHAAELVERELELEDKVRATREEFQEQVAALESEHRDRLAVHEAEMAQRLAAIEEAARADIEALTKELADRDERYGSAEEAVATARSEVAQLGDELGATRDELAEASRSLSERTAKLEEYTDRVANAERESVEAAQRAAKLAADLEAATNDNADLNRRLQEVEARRALELADTEGRADLDELLRVTQERLAGQTEKLIGAEDRAHDLERELKARAERIDQVEAELRQLQMSQAMRQIRSEGQDDTDGAMPSMPELSPDDRRATSPFLKELSIDARRSLTQILGLTQILKHKKDPKDQAQLVRQLTAFARRLDHTVSDMTDADTLVHGQIQLNRKRSDLEALVQRVVEESGADADHEVRVIAERVMASVDPLRTEQILAGLIRSSADRTPAKKLITIRLQPSDGGALISVEDPEPSSDASMSPVVQRFAEVQGGWAKVTGLQDGGSAFRVFLPDGPREPSEPPAEDTAPEIAAADSEAPATSDASSLHIVVEEQEGVAGGWTPSEEQLLVQELHRLSELTAED